MATIRASGTLTAADTADGRRPLVDLTSGNRWIVDGTEGPVDLEAIDVRTLGGELTLAAWLGQVWDLEPAQVLDLGSTRLELEPHGSPSTGDPIGLHEEELIGRCTCTLYCECISRSCFCYRACSCEWDGTMCGPNPC